jgi:hypothetical protein
MSVLSPATLKSPKIDPNFFLKSRIPSNNSKAIPVNLYTISEITGEGKGTLLPTHELSKTPGLYYDGEWKNKT